MKNKLIKSTLILLVGGFITKILGMIIKMVMGRLIGTQGLGLYMMILPTFSLFIGLGQAGLPIALSKLIAEDKNNNKKLFFSILPVTLFINCILVIIVIIIAPFISKYLLKNDDVYLGLMAIAIVIPFTSISSICRSYFFGKERMIPHVVSNITEDLIRLCAMIMFIPLFLKKDISYLICFLILINVISEGASILILFLFLPKKIIFTKDDFKPSKIYIKDSLSIGIPNTCSRLIGSIGYFFEPILLMNVLEHIGYPSSFITREYGVLSGYVMPILLLPSFFTSAISNALLPTISKDFAKIRKDSAKKKLKLGIGVSLVIGSLFTILFMIFPEIILRIIYKTSEGANYMTFLAPICLLQYIQAPLNSCLDAASKSNQIMKANIIGMITRTSLLVCLSFFNIGLWGLIIAISINVIVITVYSLKKVIDLFKEKEFIMK